MPPREHSDNVWIRPPWLQRGLERMMQNPEGLMLPGLHYGLISKSTWENDFLPEPNHSAPSYVPHANVAHAEAAWLAARNAMGSAKSLTEWGDAYDDYKAALQQVELADYYHPYDRWWDGPWKGTYMMDGNHLVYWMHRPR